MNNTLIFFTGARSEYGIMKNLIQRIAEDESINYSIIVSGMHLMKGMGNTIEEIINDGYTISKKITAYSEDRAPGADEFSIIVKEVSNFLIKAKPKAIFLIGDRPESYAAALGAHFSKVPIIHFGGGTITEGALDNIYRYNISNLSTFHFATSLKNYERLCKVPVLIKENIFFTGSFATDAILKFKKNVSPIKSYISELDKNKFALMTFHSATASGDKVGPVMSGAIQHIISQNVKVLITYPNNDPGYEEVIEVIDSYKDYKDVIIIKHLGAQRYYAALNDCLFVIGNSSSGLIEAPYFNKRILNIGDRQKGREMDDGVINLSCNKEVVLECLDINFKKGWSAIKNNEIYGDGTAIEKALNIIKSKIITHDSRNQ